MDKEREPGTARFGNFINYYSFNPPGKRLDLLPPTPALLQTLRSSTDTLPESLVDTVTDPMFVLDVGCNAGDLTVAAYERLTGLEAANNDTQLTKDIPQAEVTPATKYKPKIHMLGVDLDARLVERCTTNNPHPQQIDFKVADLLKDADRASVIDTYLGNGQTSCFDLAMCFSVTLWVHLNHGDLGLQSFLSYLASRSRYLLIEPQPWKCYRTAVRRMKRSKCEPFKHFDSLLWRENVDDDILSYLRWECGMEVVEQYGRTDWDRKVCLLKNTNMM